ncbi:FAD-dependent oxidoreductase [Stappia sp. GBMRC 2046]|uniref:FAD-dependent oxidoreductase n=1 Tax=Stappia sediminis TaxID=2692190 RepID=A0A7X3LXR1_9HYPH|nr:FAD-dependent oxidoreductase [Stappia sediminis]MXN67114.1 FAD-dependent oxidoreductase [Stappia sediminis]
MRRHCIVIGGGIMGASAAYHLARAGARVTVLEKGEEPAPGVTRHAFGWINLINLPPDATLELYRFRNEAVQGYRGLDGELGGKLGLRWCGSLVWKDTAEKTERLFREHMTAGNRVELAGPERIVELEPGLEAIPDCAVHSPDEAVADPLHVTKTLLDAARERGAEIRFCTEVEAIETLGGSVSGVRAGEGFIETDAVIVTAGARAKALLQPLGIDPGLSTSPAVLLRFKAENAFVRGVVSNPDLEVRQGAGNEVLVAEDYSEAEDQAEVRNKVLASIRDRFSGTGAIQSVSLTVGQRPMPDDGMPIVGRAWEIDGLFLAVAHAGLILGPLAGKLLTREIMEDAAAAIPTSISAKRRMRFQGEG